LGGGNDCPRSIVTVRNFDISRRGAETCIFTGKDVLREEHVNRAMSYVVIAECVSNLWLKDVELGKNYITGLVQAYLDIFKDFQGRF